MKRVIFTKFVLCLILLPILNIKVAAEPERVWEIQASPDPTSRERILRSPHVANSRPQKIRLVNYEQRHLARQQFEGNNARNISYLEMVRQKMRGGL